MVVKQTNQLWIGGINNAIILRKLCYARRDQYLVYTVVPITILSLLTGIFYNLLLLPPGFDPSKFNLTNTNNITYNTIPVSHSHSNNHYYMNIKIAHNSITNFTNAERNISNVFSFAWQILLFLNKLLVDWTTNILNHYYTINSSNIVNTNQSSISTNILHPMNSISLSNVSNSHHRHHVYVGNYTDDSQSNNDFPTDLVSNIMTIFFYYLMFLGRCYLLPIFILLIYIRIYLELM